ncbi:hypothetical protein [Marinobacterium aestuariivivens]|uniref:Uncharacterized protein n=1 Tax=Marinobacterium aestuariivivens TaxID=1698799 RepID=A0ABW2AA09_9GAMM
MYLDVNWRGLDRNDATLFCHLSGAKELSDAKRYRENRKLVQAYLYRVQQRINAGHKKGAIYLFNRLVALIDAPCWLVVALAEQLDTTPLSHSKRE